MYRRKFFYFEIDYASCCVKVLQRLGKQRFAKIVGKSCEQHEKFFPAVSCAPTSAHLLGQSISYCRRN